ncbi:metal-sulfur cluster assembly factor [Acidovorax sp. GBBC 3334]|uniref:metal-sulfur cluster assembly factor n=1 Tax=Acidovorax sp. GBBC 3334 TaxID=2940496 RepID=UPI0023038D77|nr:metal-sulfur cluster assembly factor [Acidovorax sp. GBBC 3334]MDA8457257.1 metal-sulfur cluster assembly factor [Acidovorax sp. GBBC 3334]
MPAADASLTVPYPYDGPDALRAGIFQALDRVVDPELALSIVDVGLVYGVAVTPDRLHVRMTMTSAACPVADVILDAAEDALDAVAPPGMEIALELVWEPAWTPGRLSRAARVFMGW